MLYFTICIFFKNDNGACHTIPLKSDECAKAMEVIAMTGDDRFIWPFSVSRHLYRGRRGAGERAKTVQVQGHSLFPIPCKERYWHKTPWPSSYPSVICHSKRTEQQLTRTVQGGLPKNACIYAHACVNEVTVLTHAWMYFLSWSWITYYEYIVFHSMLYKYVFNTFIKHN